MCKHLAKKKEIDFQFPSPISCPQKSFALRITYQNADHSLITRVIVVVARETARSVAPDQPLQILRETATRRSIACLGVSTPDLLTLVQLPDPGAEAEIEFLCAL